MDTEVDLTTVDRDVLIAIIAELQAVIERLQRRIAELEGQAKPGDPLRMPGLKAKSARKPPAQQGPRKQRRHGFAPPAHDTHPPGGARDGELSRLRRPPVPAVGPTALGKSSSCRWFRRKSPSTSTLLGLARRADGAAHLRRNWTAWSWAQQRLGVNLLSLIATLREEGRLPIRSVQWYLETVHQLRLSVGAMVSAIHRTAQRAQPAVAAILDRIRASPVVHADETGWRQSGANGYVWTFSTPTERYFLRRGRGKTVVDEALSDAFSGVLVSDFYAAYHHYDGPKQRCWAHLLRDIHDQRTRYPKDAALARWAAAVHTSSMSQPKPATITSHGKGVLPNWPGSGSCWPSAALSCLTRRLSRASCAGASSATSGNSSSSWPNRTCQRTTTRPSAACAIWLSAARSAAAPARSRAPRAR